MEYERGMSHKRAVRTAPKRLSVTRFEKVGDATVKIRYSRVHGNNHAELPRARKIETVGKLKVFQ